MRQYRGRLEGIAGKIADLLRVLDRLDRDGRESGRPNRALMLHYKVGVLINVFKRQAKQAGISHAVRVLANLVSRTQADLVAHARLTHTPVGIARANARQGTTWRELADVVRVIDSIGKATRRQFGSAFLS